MTAAAGADAGQGIRLPDCRRKRTTETPLTERERQELITRIAESGKAGLDQFLDESKRKEGGIARRLAQVRERLARRAEQAQAKAARDEAVRRGRQIARATRHREEQGKRAERIQRALQRLEGLGAGDVDLLAGRSELVSLVIEADDRDMRDLSLWQRFRWWLARVWARFVDALRRFWAWLSGRARGLRLPRRQGRISPIVIRGLEGLESRFGNALLTSPRLQWRIDSQLRSRTDEPVGPLQLGWRKRFDKEWYRREATKIFDEELRRAQREQRRAGRSRRDRLAAEAAEVQKSIEAAERDLRSEVAEIARRTQDRQSQLERDLEHRSREAVAADLARQLERLGYVQRSGDRLDVTARLIDRFATILFGKEMAALQGARGVRLGEGEQRHGIFEKARLRSILEESRFDAVESLVRARLNHPGHRHLEPEDLIVFRELQGRTSHVVLMFDKSSSMAENQRITAAKKAVLALWKAAKRHDLRCTVDLVAFDTSVKVMDLVGLWTCTPEGFTNIGGALATARGILRGSSADHQRVYLITDGLPEAYREAGQDRAGDLDKALRYAQEQALALRTDTGAAVTLIMLEPKEEVFVRAAEGIAAACEGSLIVTDPRKLAGEMLADFTRMPGGGLDRKRTAGRVKRLARA